MTEAVLQSLYKQQHQIKTESINIDALEHYSLHFLVKPNRLAIGVVDNTRGRYILFEDYEIKSSRDPENGFSEILKEVIEDHFLLKAGFWKNIRVAFQNRCFTLVPSGLFDKNNLEIYLSQSIEYDPKKFTVKAYKQLSLDAINVFACEKDIVNVFDTIYAGKDIEYIHETSAFVEGCFRNQHADQENVFVSIEDKQFTMVVILGSKLQFCNVFSYKTKEDFAYYLLFAMKELELDTETALLTLWGEIMHDSDLFELIRKYVRFVEIGKRPKYLNFPYHFDELQDQRFFTLFLQHLCE